MDAIVERSEAAENERLLLEMVDKFLEAEVKPHVRALEHDACLLPVRKPF
jgi:hypothetical protein